MTAKKKTPPAPDNATGVEFEPRLVRGQANGDVALWDWNDGTFQIGVTMDSGASPVAVATLGPTERSQLARLLVEALPENRVDGRQLSALNQQIRELEDECDRYKEHSVILNAIGYVVARYLGKANPPNGYYGDAADDVAELIQRNHDLDGELQRAHLAATNEAFGIEAPIPYLVAESLAEISHAPIVGIVIDVLEEMARRPHFYVGVTERS